MKENLYPNRIPFDLKEYQHESDYFEIEGFTLTEEEKKYFPNLIDLGDLLISVDVMPAGNMYTLTMTVEGDIHLEDVHDGATRSVNITDGVDVIIAPDNEEENDIDPDEDGIYDLRGSVLALLFDAVPKNYSEVPLQRIEKDNYVIMSEDEYNATRRNTTSSPFDDINLDDYPDNEEK